MLTTADPTAAISYLKAARKEWTQADLASALGISSRQLRRWEQGDCLLPSHVAAELQRMLKFGPPAKKGQFTFIDLFAGIGGIRHAFEKIGGECVFTSEWDAFAQKTYLANFPDSRHSIAGDITQVDAQDIPDHDLLLAGFPCQPFSIAGVSKKNALGRAHGFSDETQGTLFFDVARIIDAKQPKAFMLENVKNLQSHDGGRTFDVILRTLKEELGYQVFYEVIDGAHFVPQHRERIIIVGFRDANFFDWDMLDLPNKGEHVLGEILHRRTTEPRIAHDEDRFFDHANFCVPAKYTLTDNLWTYLQNYKKKHQAAGNGFGFGLVTPSSVTRTLSARYYKDGSEILLDQGAAKNPRRLTPRECARLMGFPDAFKIPVSDTRAYKQFGNSVVVPVIEAVAEVMQPFLIDSQALPAIAEPVLLAA
jgi:DNA (cytosine-5)-methyltransferase 1